MLLRKKQNESVSMRPMLKIGLLLAGCFCATGSGRAACEGPPSLKTRLQSHPDAQSYGELGSWFAARRQYTCAADAFRSALRMAPKSARFSYLLGLSLYSSGSAEAALLPLQQSIGLDAKALRPRLILAGALTQLQRNAEAEAQWRAALRIDPRSSVALNGLSNSLMERGDYDSVIALLHPVSRDEDLTLDLALAYGKAGRLEEAADTLTAALHNNPSSTPLTTALATVFVNQARYQDAAELTKELLRRHPDNLAAQKLFLRVAVIYGDPSSALSLGRKLLAGAPRDFELLYQNGILERQAREYSAARKHLRAAVDVDPSHSAARYNLGLVLAELDDPHGAREQLEKALDLGSTEPKVRFELARVLRTLGEAQPAKEQLELYQQALQAKARGPVAADKAARASQELATGDPRKAVGLYREALEATPEDALLAYNLALALDRTGDMAAERTALERAVQIDPSLAIAQNQLGYLASRAGDSALAEKHFRQAVSAAPDYTQAWVSLAATLGMESRFSEAQEALTHALRLEPHNAEALQLRQALSASQAQH